MKLLELNRQIPTEPEQMVKITTDVESSVLAAFEFNESRNTYTKYVRPNLDRLAAINPQLSVMLDRIHRNSVEFGFGADYQKAEGLEGDFFDTSLKRSGDRVYQAVRHFSGYHTFLRFLVDCYGDEGVEAIDSMHLYSPQKLGELSLEAGLTPELTKVNTLALIESVGSTVIAEHEALAQYFDDKPDLVSQFGFSAAMTRLEISPYQPTALEEIETEKTSAEPSDRFSLAQV